MSRQAIVYIDNQPTVRQLDVVEVPAQGSWYWPIFTQGQTRDFEITVKYDITCFDIDQVPILDDLQLVVHNQTESVSKHIDVYARYHVERDPMFVPSTIKQRVTLPIPSWKSVFVFCAGDKQVKLSIC